MKRGWYSRVVFPRLLDWSSRKETFGPLRESLLAEATGAVLEIGCGTGANLPFYPSGVGPITAIDRNSAMVPLAAAHLSASPTMVGPVRWVIASGEVLPFRPGSFDTIVSTMTLCSIPQIPPVLQEVYRVLKPGGKFLFLEHGLSPDRPVSRWQDWLTPVWKLPGDGCHLNRPIEQLIRAQSWAVPSIKVFYLEGVPRPFGYFYEGWAVKEG